MRILVSGASGLVGSALVPALAVQGHQITRLVRQQLRPGASEIYWDPTSRLDPTSLAGTDAVVHLAGESIASSRWTAAKKARMRDSRVQGTLILSNALARCSPPPRVLVSASAVGYYGNRGDELLTEDSAAGSDFLATTCVEWEAATKPAEAARVRVVKLRFGMILSPRGGGLAFMLPPFKMGLGGRLGSGRQWMSWISIDDVVGVVQQALANDSLRGVVNAVAPQAVTNAEFTGTLGSVLHRPTIFPMPAFAVRLVFGEMGEELLLASQRVEPVRLKASGYKFRHAELQTALEDLLHRK